MLKANIEISGSSIDDILISIDEIKRMVQSGVRNVETSGHESSIILSVEGCSETFVYCDCGEILNYEDEICSECQEYAL